MKKRGDTMSLRIDGKKISSDIKEELKEQVKLLKEEGISVCLAVIQVGSDPASSVYVNNKKKACAYIGIESQAYELPEETTQEELMAIVDKCNKDPKINGILVQLPLPKQLDEDELELYSKWLDAKAVKDFEKADQYREELIQKGII